VKPAADEAATLLEGGEDRNSVNKNTPSKHRRLLSLDIQRGLTIALMVFADEIGEAYPHLNHSPWSNITMADYVMPWFLFMVGTSMVISHPFDTIKCYIPQPHPPPICAGLLPPKIQRRDLQKA